jgi:hypothetical protein
MRGSMKKVLFSGSALALSAPMYVFAAGLTNPTNTNLPEGTLMEIITNLMQWLLIIVGVVAVIAFLIAGLLYLTSAGDEGRIEKAKEAMIAAIIGIIVALAGLIALNAIESWLSGDKTTF